MDEIVASVGISDPVKKAKVSETITDLLSQMSRQAVRESDVSWERKLLAIIASATKEVKAEIMEEVDKRVAAHVSKVDSKIDEESKQIKKLQEDVDALKKKDALSTASGIGAGPASSSGERGGRSEWRPTKVEIKGFVSGNAWRKGNESFRDEQSKSKDECVMFAKRVFDALPEDRLRQLIDLEPLKGYSSSYLYSRVDVHIASDAPRGSASELKEAIESVFKTSNFHDCRNMRVTVEIHPVNRPASKLMGKALAELRQLGANNESMKPAWNPTSIKYMADGRPITAFVHEDGMWRIAHGKAQMLPDMEDSVVLAALNRS